MGSVVVYQMGSVLHGAKVKEKMKNEINNNIRYRLQILVGVTL